MDISVGEAVDRLELGGIRQLSVQLELGSIRLELGSINRTGHQRMLLALAAPISMRAQQTRLKHPLISLTF